MRNGRFKLVDPPHRGPQTIEAPRGDRLPHFIDMAPGADTALDDLNVAVIGAGSVGRNIVDRLARLQIRGIFIVDPGRFKAQSLLTHPINVEDVKNRAWKAQNAAQHASALSPSTSAGFFNGVFQDLDMTALVNVDLIAMATDNLAAEVATSQRCLQLRKPLVHAAVHGETLTAQSRWYTNADGAGPCIRCGFSKLEKQHLDSHTEFSCSGVAGQQQLKQTSGPPTMSVSSLCALSADITVMSILRYALKLGAPLTDSQVEFCGYTNKTVVSPLRPKSDLCPCHDPWRIECAIKPLRNASLRELITASGASANGTMTGLSVQIDDRLFIELASCSACGTSPIRKFVIPGRPAGFCKCGKRIYAQPFFSPRVVPVARVQDVLDRPLRKIGAGGARGVLVRNTQQTVLFVNKSEGSIP